MQEIYIPISDFTKFCTIIRISAFYVILQIYLPAQYLISYIHIWALKLCGTSYLPGTVYVPEPEDSGKQHKRLNVHALRTDLLDLSLILPDVQT